MFRVVERQFQQVPSIVNGGTDISVNIKVIRLCLEVKILLELEYLTK